jgi:hypothetical protein
MKDQVPELDSWRAAATEQWSDSRIVDAEFIDLHIWLHLHSYADFAKFGATLDGFSFCARPDGWLLVVKATIADTPQVAFVSSETTTGSVRIFRRLLRMGEVRWYPDKFRSV